MADEFFLAHKHIVQKSSQGSTFKRNFYSEKNASRFNNSSSNVNTNSNTSHKQNNPGFSKYTSRDYSQKPSSTESSSQDKMPSVFCAYCKRQGHVILYCLLLKARKERKPVVAYTSADSSFKQDFMDSMPVHQDLTSVYHDSMPVHQDLPLVYQDSTPVL